MSIWKLSPQSDDDCGKLFERTREMSIAQRSRDTVNLIEQLADRNETGAILAIASGLFSSKRTIHDAASAALQKLVPLVPSVDLVQLDEMFRGYRGWYLSGNWTGISPEYAKEFLAKSKDLTVASLLSFHHKGYVRHQAIRFLASVNNGAELRFLMVRQNDWVTAIAQDAQSIVLKKLDSDYLPHFAKEKDLIFHQLDCKRRDLSEIAEKFVDQMTLPEHRTQLESSVRSCSGRLGREYVASLLQRDGDHLADVVRVGVESIDPIVRCKCLKLVDKYLDKEQSIRIAELLQSDKFIPVRMEAYELKARLMPAESESVWSKCLFDKSKSIRASAIFYLQKLNCNVAEIYRGRLLDDPVCLPALSGLVVVGDESDLALFSDMLVSPFSNRRVEAVRGIGNHGHESAKLDLRQMLLDKSAKVVRAAFQQLLPIAKSIDSDSLFGMLEKCNTLAGKKFILQLLLEKGRWAGASYLLRVVADGESNCVEDAKALMWQALTKNRTFTQPSSTQRAEIQSIINESISTLDNPFWRDLASHLSSFGFVFPPRN